MIRMYAAATRESSLARAGTQPCSYNAALKECLLIANCNAVHPVKSDPRTGRSHLRGSVDWEVLTMSFDGRDAETRRCASDRQGIGKMTLNTFVTCARCHPWFPFAAIRIVNCGATI